MNRVQRESWKEFLTEADCGDAVEWLWTHGFDSPQWGICSHCGYMEDCCDPDTDQERCPDCNRPGTFSSVLILLGVI
jgi:hypothetical protein